MTRRTPAENRAVMNLAQTMRDLQKLQTSARHADETQDALERGADDAQATLDAARERVVKGIVDAAPLPTPEQRETLRPILAGTLPADAGRADSTAA